MRQNSAAHSAENGAGGESAEAPDQSPPPGLHRLAWEAWASSGADFAARRFNGRVKKGFDRCLARRPYLPLAFGFRLSRREAFLDSRILPRCLAG